MKKLKGIFICLALVCLLAACATNQSQDAVSEIETSEAIVSVLVTVEPDVEPAPVIEPEPEPKPEPIDTVVEDFILSELMLVYDGSPKVIEITPLEGKSNGTITIYYDGSTEAPVNSGVYNVTFDVSESEGFKAAMGLTAGTLVVYIDNNELLNSYLSGFGTTRAANPVNVVLITNNLTGLNNVIINSGKHINLDLSYSNELTIIGDNAFMNCRNLINIILPNSVTSIRQNAFRDCSSLTGIIVPNNVTSIGSSAFEGCSSLTGITIPNSVTNIGAYAFSDCVNLTNVTIPASVITIGTSPFYRCRNLVAIDVVSDNPAFSSIDGILYNKNQTAFIQYPAGKTASINIPESVIRIEINAFRSSRLTGVTIPASVTHIGSDAFVNCINITSINVDSNNTAFSSVDGILYNKNMTTLICFPGGKSGDIIIPDGVIRITSQSFWGNSNITSVTLPDSVTDIGNLAFTSCSRLISINIPNNVTRIGSSIFHNCSALSNITIPASIISIGDNAFNGCFSLTNVTFNGNISASNFSSTGSFPGDLRDKYLENGPGTYTRLRNSQNWTYVTDAL